jgi:hypothetical protein
MERVVIVEKTRRSNDVGFGNGDPFRKLVTDLELLECSADPGPIVLRENISYTIYILYIIN